MRLLSAGVFMTQKGRLYLSRIPEFYKLSLEERVREIQTRTNLTDEEIDILRGAKALTPAQADRMSENVVGTFSLPLAIATNFLIDGKDYFVPMAIEEPSVVAGASHGAKLAREGGGFTTEATPPLMIGQIQVVDLADPYEAVERLLDAKGRLLEEANKVDPVIVGLGGGAQDIEPRVIDSPRGPMLILHLLYDVRDAMGANVVNTALETIAPLVEEITGGRVNLRIISNLADRRLASAQATLPQEALTFDGFEGKEVVERILEAHAFAQADPYRAATHNKGIMNGIDGLALATGNDWRAIEAGAHAYAARNGRYSPLTSWHKDEEGNLLGSIELPISVGIVGGATWANPTAKVALKILGVKSATELSRVMAAVGLAQNLAALRALATEGIQRGHMALHARNVALSVGVPEECIDQVVDQMVEERKIRPDRAQEIARELVTSRR